MSDTAPPASAAPKRKIGLAEFYNAIMAPRGFSLAPHHYPVVAGLEDTRIENLLLIGPPGTGKSNLLCTAYPLWAIGEDPTQTVLSVSAAAGLPTTFMTASMQIIQNSKVWKEFYPDVTPAVQQGWSVQRGLFVNGHVEGDENASYVACGLDSKTLTGLHCRTMILDDIHEPGNSATPEGRLQVKTRYYDTLMGRADPRGVRRVAAGRWWAHDDLYQEFIAGGDWVVLELPAVRPGNRKLWYDVYVPKGLTCVYTETLKPNAEQDPKSPYVKYRAYYAAADTTGEGFYWPGSPSKRKEYKTVAARQPRTAAVNYRGDMSGGGESVFNKEDFRTYLPPDGLNFGIAHQSVRLWCDSMKGDIEDAWDTAAGQVKSESKTANITGLMVPCQCWHNGEDARIIGACDFHYDVYLLDFWQDSVSFGKLAEVFRTRRGLWWPKRMNVEEKQSGISLLQVMRTAGLPVHPIKVVEGKLERAVNPVLIGELPIGGGAASVQGWVQMGRVNVPAGAPWVDELLETICAYSGGTRNTDAFDTLVHLITRAVLKSRKRGLVGHMPSGAGRSDVRPAGGSDDPRYAALEGMSLLSQQQTDPRNHGVANPFDSFCGAPCHWFTIHENSEYCRTHKRRTTAFDGCPNWAVKGSVQEDATLTESGAF